MNKEKILVIVTAVIIPLIIFAATPYWNSIFSEKRKIEYITPSKSQPFSDYNTLDSKNWARLKLSYLGKPIENPTFVGLVIKNSGDLPIKSEDWEGNITFPTIPPLSINEFRIVKTSTESLTPNFKITPKGLELSPLLLNAGDAIYIEAFSTQDFKFGKPIGRILGIKEINEIPIKDSSGITIEKVDDNGYGRSTRKTLFPLSPYLLLVVGFALIVIPILFFPTTDSIQSNYLKITINILLYVPYTVGVSAITLFPLSITNIEFTKTAKYATAFTLVAIIISFAIYWQRYIIKNNSRT